MRKLTKLQQKLRDSGQLKSAPLPKMPDNSVMLEKLESQSNLMKMKKAELLEMADKLSLEVNSKNTKAEIIKAIQNQAK